MKALPWMAHAILLSIALSLAGCNSSDPYRRFAFPESLTRPSPIAAPAPLFQAQQALSGSRTQATAVTTPGVVSITPENTKIEFTGSTALTSQSGHFTSFNGVLELPSDNPLLARIHVVVDLNSISTSIPLLAHHLKQEDFFDVEHYPRAEFFSETIALRPELGVYSVTGILQFHGVSKRIEFPASINFSPTEVRFDGTMTIVQTAFGMTEAAAKTKDEVPVRVIIQSRRT